MIYNQAQLDSIRLQLIECAQMRPKDIENFYGKYLLNVDDCRILASDAPRNIAMLYRGKLRNYDASIVSFVLAGKNPYAERTCGVANCLNPDHVVE